MAERSLGYITPGLNPTPLTINQTDPTAKVQAHNYRVWHNPIGNQNIGNCYIGNSALEPATGEGMTGVLYAMAVLGGPPYYYEGPYVEEGHSNPYDLSTIYISADNTVDTFLVTYIEG